MSKICVLLADDHAVLREGLHTLLSLQDDIEVVGEAENGQMAVEMAKQLHPDIVVMDIAMPIMDGLEATRALKQQVADVRVLILSQHDNREYVFSVLQAGAAGYVLKKSGGAEVIQAIRSVYKEGAYLPPGIAREVMDRYIQRPIEETGRPHLTEREKEVLRMIAEGRSNKDIAELLCLSVKTVMAHRTNIMEKLDIHSSTELVKYAIKQGLISV